MRSSWAVWNCRLLRWVFLAFRRIIPLRKKNTGLSFWWISDICGCAVPVSGPLCAFVTRLFTRSTNISRERVLCRWTLRFLRGMHVREPVLCLKRIFTVSRLFWVRADSYTVRRWRWPWAKFIRLVQRLGLRSRRRAGICLNSGW